MTLYRGGFGPNLPPLEPPRGKRAPSLLIRSESPRNGHSPAGCFNCQDAFHARVGERVLPATSGPIFRIRPTASDGQSGQPLCHRPRKRFGQRRFPQWFGRGFRGVREVEMEAVDDIEDIRIAAAMRCIVNRSFVRQTRRIDNITKRPLIWLAIRLSA